VNNELNKYVEGSDNDVIYGRPRAQNAKLYMLEWFMVEIGTREFRSRQLDFYRHLK